MPKCKAPDCELKSKAKGYCIRHYSQVRVHGRLRPDLEVERVDHSKLCSVEGCDNHQEYRSGLCKRHQAQHARNGEIKRCAVIDCNNLTGVNKQNMCEKHNKQHLKVLAKKQFERICNYE